MSCDCESAPPQECPTGVPAWVLTFADLMSLLLAFFVLLFSFSEMDRQKYKQVAGSMRDAFGIQRQIKIKEPPKGINIIAQEFSAGTPTSKTLENELRQHTTDDYMQYLKMPVPKLDQKLEDEGYRLRQALMTEIDEGLIEINVDSPRIVIRILERGSFASGSTTLIEPFRSIIDKIAKAIRLAPGLIVAAGHTDNVPISTSRFRSNWELSASRAVTVVHELLAHGSSINAGRFRIEGFGDTRPIDTNDTPEGRARNRRVEVTMLYDEEETGMEAGQAQQAVDAIEDSEIVEEDGWKTIMW
jgi:chemotaxis protein MotB